MITPLLSMLVSPLVSVPRIPVGHWIDHLFTWLKDNLDPFFQFIHDVMQAVVDGIISALTFPDPVLLAVLFALLALVLRGWKFGLGALVGMLLIISMREWDAAMQTLALVGVAAFIALLIGIPLGIVAARTTWGSALLRPVMDFMQTMPAFVWLVPVVSLFSIGPVPGVIATIIFALPPGVRLTELGIRGVDAEVVEAANAFGSTPRQTLFGVQLPLALPTIMAGVNQVIMLALSMAVIAGLVGAEGLGGAVTASIAELDVGKGFEAGISVVILAIYLDRLTGAIGQGHGGGLQRLFSRRRRRAAPASGSEESPEQAEGDRSPAGAGATTKVPEPS